MLIWPSLMLASAVPLVNIEITNEVEDDWPFISIHNISILQICKIPLLTNSLL